MRREARLALSSFLDLDLHYPILYITRKLFSTQPIIVLTRPFCTLLSYTCLYVLLFWNQRIMPALFLVFTDRRGSDSSSPRYVTSITSCFQFFIFFCFYKTPPYPSRPARTSPRPSSRPQSTSATCSGWRRTHNVGREAPMMPSLPDAV